MEDIFKIITPALSALVGGLMAILGGLLVQRKDKAENNMDFLRSKIEEIYQHTIGTEDWLSQEIVKIHTYVENGKKIDLDRLKSKSKHVRMLLKLYFNNSVHVCDELDKYEMLFFEGMKLAYSAPVEFNRPEQKETILQASKLYLVALLQIRKFLESEMKKLTSY